MNVLVGELVLQLDSALNVCFFLFFVVVVFHLNKGWSTQTRTFHPITAVTHRFVAVSSGHIVWSTVWSLMDGNISTAQSLKKTSKGTKFVQIAFWLQVQKHASFPMESVLSVGFTGWISVKWSKSKRVTWIGKYTSVSNHTVLIDSLGQTITL